MIASSPSQLHFAERSPQPFAPRSFLAAKLGQLWRIETGFVRTMTWLEDGTSIVLGIWGAGDVIGKPLTRLEPYQIECITKVEATPVPLSEVSELTEVLLAHLQQSERLMQIRSYKRVDIMLLKFLSWLAERFGQDVESGRLINLRLTHLDIAEAIGSTRVTVTRILNQLERQGIIQCLPLKRIILHEEELWHYEI